MQAEDRATFVSRHAAGAGARRLALFAAVALAVVILDQFTKAQIRAWLAPGESWPAGQELLRLSHAENSGAAFGMLQGAGALLLAASAIGVAAVLVYLFLVPRSGRLFGLALALILGGAAGNLIDRAFRGTVTDFIDPTHYPAFNVADSALTIGVVLIALATLRSDHGHEPDGGRGGRAP